MPLHWRMTETLIFLCKQHTTHGPKGPEEIKLYNDVVLSNFLQPSHKH